jgi:hypothetical protein
VLFRSEAVEELDDLWPPLAKQVLQLPRLVFDRLKPLFHGAALYSIPPDSSMKNSKTR